MSVTENIDRIQQGKTSIISSIKSKGVNVPNDVLINEIAPYINEIQGGGGSSELPEVAENEDILVIENIDRIEQGKTSIISSIKSKGVNVPSGILINEIAPYINEIQGGGGSSELPEVAENEDILVIENVDEVEGTVFLNNPNNIAIQYSTNGESFSDYTTASEISIKPNEKVYFKWSDVISGTSNLDALVKSLVKYNVYGELKKGNESYAYKLMFNNQSNLIDASKLKLTATELASSCYGYMFANCKALTTAPALPSTQLGQGCYSNMFYGCTNLTQSPELPATQLASNCYFSMFANCKALTTAPELPATTLVYSCYSNMFKGCSSLTTAPELPATELASYCYYNMFRGCTALNYVKHYITEWNTSNTTDWLKDVAPNGTVECPIDSTIPSDSTSGVPTGWTRVNI